MSKNIFRSPNAGGSYELVDGEYKLISQTKPRPSRAEREAAKQALADKAAEEQAAAKKAADDEAAKKASEKSDPKPRTNKAANAKTDKK